MRGGAVASFFLMTTNSNVVAMRRKRERLPYCFDCPERPFSYRPTSVIWELSSRRLFGVNRSSQTGRVSALNVGLGLGDFR
jgi:hypothetical protein